MTPSPQIFMFQAASSFVTVGWYTSSRQIALGTDDTIGRVLFGSSCIWWVLTLIAAYQRRKVLREVAEAPYEPSWAGLTFPTVSTSMAALLFQERYPNQVLQWYTQVLGAVVFAMVIFINLHLMWHLPAIFGQDGNAADSIAVQGTDYEQAHVEGPTGHPLVSSDVQSPKPATNQLTQMNN